MVRLHRLDEGRELPLPPFMPWIRLAPKVELLSLTLKVAVFADLFEGYDHFHLLNINKYEKYYKYIYGLVKINLKLIIWYLLFLRNPKLSFNVL